MTSARSLVNCLVGGRSLSSPVKASLLLGPAQNHDENLEKSAFLRVSEVVQWIDEAAEHQRSRWRHHHLL